MLYPKCLNLYKGVAVNSLAYRYNGNIIDKESYIASFEKNETSRNVYRRLVKFSEVENDLQMHSLIMSEIEMFLKIYTLDSEIYRDNMAEIIVELLSNAHEHALSDCLLDLDVSDLIKNKDVLNGNFVSFNISEINLGDKVRKK